MGYLDFGRGVVPLEGQHQPMALVKIPEGYLEVGNYIETSKYLVLPFCKRGLRPDTIRLGPCQSEDELEET
jgi:hypothetical protein